MEVHGQEDYYFTEMIDKAESKQLAELHYQNLSQNTVSLLGLKYLRPFYRFIYASDYETVYSIRDKDGVIKSVCVISESPESLMVRAISKTFWIFLIQFYRNFFVSRSLRLVVLSVIKELLMKKSYDLSPDIYFFFTDSQNRGKGLGTNLLQFVEKSLIKSGHKYIYVRTLNDEAIKFYKKNGFKEFATRKFANRDYLILRKQLINK